MCKDKDKQREANRERQRRYKARQKALLNGGVTLNDDGSVTVPDKLGPLKPKRGKDLKCFADLQATINQMSRDDNGKIVESEKAKRTASAIRYQHLFPDRYEPTSAVCSGVVTGKPGDADYNGICTPEWRAERGRGVG